MIEDRESVVSDLLLEWEERRQENVAVSVAELCRDHPELADELAQRIRALQAVYCIPNRAEPGKDRPLHAAADVLPTIPGFEVVGRLGHGGMGVVYKARHQRLNRLCALKMLRGGGHARPSERLRFRIEAEAVAALHHPQIVQLFEVGDVEGLPFLALEYVEGQTLAERLRSGLLDVHPAAKLVATLAEAMDYAHRRGVIHRDLKPGNVLLTDDDVPKITDFGLAKRLAGQAEATGHTQTGDVLGTPGYMAPEQITGKIQEIGPLTDVYALGTILYECLTGRPPFQGTTALETLRQAVDQSPRSPSQFRKALPRDLETICLKSLEKEPAQRYASARDLADDLQRFLAGEPIRARSVGWFELTVKWAKRRPVTAALVGTVLSLLVILALGGTTLAVIALRAREAAVARENETAQVLNFVENQIFAAARPKGQMGGLGPDVSVREAIEQAVPFVEKSFMGEPLIEARLRLALGMSYYYLGDGTRSVEENERARDLYLKHLGPDHLLTIRSMSNLANSYSALGRHEDARAIYERTLVQRRKILGPDHPDTLMNMNNLANSYYGLGRHEDALQLRKETLALQQRTLGPDHPDTLKSMNNLSTSYQALGRLQEALKLREETLELRQRTLGPEHPETLGSMNNLANTYYALGRHEEALRLREKTLAMREAQLGPEHAETLMSMNNLSNSFRALKRYQEALDLREKTLALQQRTLGVDHPDTLMSMDNLAFSYADVGRYQEALELGEKLLTRQKARLGPDHSDTLGSMCRVARDLIALDQGSKAMPLIDECLQRAAAHSGDPDLLNDLIDMRLRYFEKAKDAAGCQATAEIWERLQRDDAESLYRAATLRAVTSAVLMAESITDADERALQQADLATERLRRAIAAGFHDATRLTEDKDLETLRDHDHFRRLVSNLVTEQMTEQPP